MSLRIFSSPPVSSIINGATVYDALASKYCNGNVNFFPSTLSGSPASSWVITIGKNMDWTAARADPQVVDLFGGDLPENIHTKADLLTFLRTRTIGDVPAARRATIQSNLDTLGVSRADFTLTTPLWRVMQRVLSTLHEKDDNFGAGFNL